jgi:outer membrane protein
VNNRISLLLNVVLLAAVAVLFFLHFKGKSTTETDTNQPKKNDSATPKLTFEVPKNLAGARVLYVNLDSIDQKYDAIKELSAEAQSYSTALLSKYKKRQMEIQEQTYAYQQKVQSGTISASEAEAEEKKLNAGFDELAKMENEISNYQNNALMRNAKIVSEISTYFKEYSKSKGVDFILGYGNNSTLLYANDSLDVTSDVLNALNATYRSSKGAKK